MPISLRIAILIIGFIFILYLIFFGYLKGKDTLVGTIIGIIEILSFFVADILNFFLNDDDAIIAMLLAFSFGMGLEAFYRTYQVKKLKRKIKK